MMEAEQQSLNEAGMETLAGSGSISVDEMLRLYGDSEDYCLGGSQL